MLSGGGNATVAATTTRKGIARTTERNLSQPARNDRPQLEALEPRLIWPHLARPVPLWANPKNSTINSE